MAAAGVAKSTKDKKIAKKLKKITKRLGKRARGPLENYQFRLGDSENVLKVRFTRHDGLTGTIRRELGGEFLDEDEMGGVLEKVVVYEIRYKGCADLDGSDIRRYVTIFGVSDGQSLEGLCRGDFRVALDRHNVLDISEYAQGDRPLPEDVGLLLSWVSASSSERHSLVAVAKAMKIDGDRGLVGAVVRAPEHTFSATFDDGKKLELAEKQVLMGVLMSEGGVLIDDNTRNFTDRYGDSERVFPGVHGYEPHSEQFDPSGDIKSAQRKDEINLDKAVQVALTELREVVLESGFEASEYHPFWGGQLPFDVTDDVPKVTVVKIDLA